MRFGVQPLHHHVAQVRVTRAQEIQEGRAVEDMPLQLEVLHDIGSGEGRRADAREVLGAPFVVEQLLAFDPEQLDADAEDAVVLDVGRRKGARPGEADPGPEGGGKAEDTVTQPLGQVGGHGELPTHDPVGLGVPGPLRAPRHVLACDEPGHLTCDVLGDPGLLRPDHLLGGTKVLVAAADVDEPLHQSLYRSAQQPVEQRADVGIGAPFELDAPQDRIVDPLRRGHRCSSLPVAEQRKCSARRPGRKK